MTGAPLTGASLTGLVLAAGAARRMRGADKLLQQVGGVPQLARITRAALDAGLVVRVALRPDRPARMAAVADMGAQLVMVADADSGMAASIRAGAAGVGGALMILPADMPDLGAPEIAALAAAQRAWPRAILRGATADGRAGHPVVIPADLVPALAGLTGDAGARALIAAHPERLRLVALPGEAALTDLDTPEDWAAWAAARGPAGR